MKTVINLENFVFAIILLLPTYLLKLAIFGLPTNLLEILISLAFIWTLTKKHNFRNIFTTKIWLLIGFIFFGLFISTIANENFLSGLGIIKGWFIFPILLAVIAKKELTKEKIYLAIYSSAFLVAIISIFYYLQGFITFDGRLQSIFNSPNYLAMYLAPAILISFANLKQALKNKNQTHRLTHLISLGAILFVMYQTHSYASWASLVVIFLIQGMLYAPKKNVLKNFTLLVILGALLISFQWQNPKFQDLVSLNKRSSSASRLMIWNSAEKILTDHWFFGIGPGNFQAEYLANQKNMPELYLEWAVPHPHNLFLSFWLQSGLIGLLAFIALLIHWLKIVLQKPNSVYTIIALAIMTYFLLHGLVDTTYFKNDLAILFWLNFIAIL
jgi:O-antigen ligase